MLGRGQQSPAVNWFNDRLKDMRDRLHTLISINKINPVLVNKTTIKEYRKNYKKEIGLAKKEANENFISSSNNPQAAMWQIINKNNQNCLPKNSEILNSQNFCDFFTNVAEEITENLPPSKKNFNDFLNSKITHQFSFKETTYIRVRDKFVNLKNSKSSDCYNINTRIVKCLKNLLTIPLTKLINRCITAGVFPSVLKAAKVIPIYKHKGSVDELNNYRPISLLPIFSKIFPY